MASLGPKQSKGYFVALAALPSTQQFIWSGASGAGGSYTPGVLTAGGGTQASGASGLISTGSLLKDMGKTVVSSSHTFRKVQAVLTAGPVVGAATAALGLPFYIELVTGQNTNQGVTCTAASVAYLPGLM